MKLDFRLLGPLAVSRDGAELALGSRKQRALLARLALHVGEPVSVGALADELATSRNAIQVYVSRLRALLDPPVVARAPAGYVLRVESDLIDARRFVELVSRARRAPNPARADLLGAALGLWRGRALADFADDSYLRADRARLEELRLAAVEARARAELELGRHAELVPELAALAAEHPLREPLHALLMTALYRVGRQADALAVYRAARERLVNELGLEPAPSLRALERRILTQRE